MIIDLYILGTHLIEKRDASNSDCGGMIDSPGQVIKSPNYPNNYDHGDECKWVIAFNHRDHIKLTVTDFELESGTNMPFNPCP